MTRGYSYLISAVVWTLILLYPLAKLHSQVLEDFEAGATGWTAASTATTGNFVLGNPIGTTYQPEDDRTITGVNAVFTAQNSGGTGFDDVDNGFVQLTSQTYPISVASTMSVWYFFGQGFVSNDPGDYHRLEYSLDGGTNYTTLASIGDARILPVWTQATVAIPAGSQFRLRLESSDGTTNGDFIESGIDDFSIISNNNVSVNDIVVNQLDGTATFTLTYNGANTSGFSVDYSTQNNTAVAGDDFVAQSGTVNFNGSSGQQIPVSITLIDNGSADVEEYFRLNISNSTNANVETGWYGNATIRGNNVIQVANATAAENSGAITFTLTYVGDPMTSSFSVNYNTLPLRAKAGADYVSTSGSVTFPANTQNGDTVQVTIPLINDAYGEATESFQLALIGTSDTQVKASNTAQGFITDSDPANVPLTIFDTFNGYYDYALTGGSLRDSDTDLCSIVAASSNELTTDIPAGATIDKAYLIWAHSAPTPDNQVTFDGTAITADIINNANNNLANNGVTFFSMVSDITAQVRTTADINNHSFTFSDLTIDNQDPYCSGTVVLGGWSLMIFYTEPNLPAVRINFYNGFDPEQNGAESYDLSGFYAIGTDKAKATVLAWEGDDDIRDDINDEERKREDISIATSAVGSPFKLFGDGSNDGSSINNPFNSTIYDDSGPTVYEELATKGIDLDTYDITPYIETGETSATIQVNAGQDLILLNSVLLKVPGNLIAGTIFEDVNYPGGPGRSLTASSGLGIGNATVELYREIVPGNYTLEDTVLSKANGEYIFGGMTDGTYKVRVVNNSVKSNRNGAGCTDCVPVQTFKSDFLGSVLTTNLNQIGGTNPQLSDSNVGTLAGAQTVGDVTITAEGIANLDFGFNFSTIVNTNNTGQGSLQQFIVNSNVLNEIGLDIEPHPNDATLNPDSGVDASIFMIPSNADPLGRSADSNYNNTDGIFDIFISNVLPTISDNTTHLDGRSQTVYSGDTNPGAIAGSGTSVGVSNIQLPFFNLPEIQIHTDTAIDYVFTIQGADVVVRNFALYTNSNSGNGIRLANSDRTIILENLVGTNSKGTPVNATRHGIRVNGTTNSVIEKNFISGNVRNGIRINRSNSLTIDSNYFLGNGRTSCESNIIVFSDGDDVTIENNLLEDGADSGIDHRGGNNLLITENTIFNTGRTYDCGAEDDATVKSGIRLNGNGVTVSKNRIHRNGRMGIYVGPGNSSGNTITENSIYNNGTFEKALGIDLEQVGVNINDLNDSDTGANGILNFPIIERASLNGSNLILSGWSNANAKIEVFLTDINQNTALVGDNQIPRVGQTIQQDYGEGQIYLTTLTEGSLDDLDSTVSNYTDIDGNTDTTARFNFSIVLPTTVALGTNLTATATIGGSTSEFGPMTEIQRSRLITNRSITYRVTPNSSAAKTAPEGTLTNDIVVNSFTDGNSGSTAFDLVIQNTNTTEKTGLYEIFIENVPYSTIVEDDFANHSLQTINNGDGTFSHLFTSTTELDVNGSGGMISIRILGFKPNPSGTGDIGKISFYKL